MTTPIFDGHESTERPRRTPRIATVVWGLLIAAAGIIVIAVTVGARLDLALVLGLALGAAGVILVASAVMAAVRRNPSDS